MATQSKTQYLTDLQAYLKRRYKPKAEKAPGRLTVIEAVVYGICREDTTREQANQALSRFKDQFFDWNEVRVSPLEEVQETLAGIPDPAGRAQRIRRFLRQLFERTYDFSLEQLTKKPLKEALKALQPFEAFTSDYVTATVVQQALGGHAIPIDESARKALENLGLHEPDVASLRGLIERAIPKNRGAEFMELLEDMAHDAALPNDAKAPRWEHHGKAAHAAAPAPAKDAKAAKPKEKDKAKDAPQEAKGTPAPPAPAPAPAPTKDAKAAKPKEKDKAKDAPKGSAPPPGKASAPKEPPPKPPKGKK
jgi:endonuclease-3